MTVADLQRAFDYNYWANEKLFAVLRQLTPEQFTQPVAGSYGSVRNTLVHVMSAEWGWIDRGGGTPRGPALVATDYPTVEALIDRWRQVESYMRAFLATLNEQDIDNVREFSLAQGTTHSLRLGEMLHHAGVHGVHHRGQVSLLLRALGHAPGNFDIMFYYLERPRI